MTGEKKKAIVGGSVRWRNGRADVRIWVGTLGRKGFSFPTCKTSEQAEQRRDLLAECVAKLTASGQEALGIKLLEQVAEREGAALRGAVLAIEKLARGEARPRDTGETTIRELGERWTSGVLARQYPDHVRTKKTADDDAERLELYIYPLAGDLPVSAFTLDHAERIMSDVPAERAPATRRHVAQVLHKLLGYAVFPLRIIPFNPLPRGWLPRLGPDKAKVYLYPDEERRLLEQTTIPLPIRMLYGFLAREGMRSWSEAARIEWADIDTERGILHLDENKTDDPRSWALRPDVVRALKIWRKLRPESDPLVFGPEVIESKPAERFRARLVEAGIERPQLYKQSKTRVRIRVHDLRATFITIALATGRSESWIADRTGHKSSTMINRYKRSARTAAETNLGDLAPLDVAIPELREAGAGGTGGDRGGPTGRKRSTRRTARPLKRSVLRHRRIAAGVLKSAVSDDVSVRARPGLPVENLRGFESSRETGSEPAREALYQRRTSRAATISRLAEEMRHLTTAGDLDGARAIHETIGRLLGASADEAGECAVIDLEAERRRRAGAVTPHRASPRSSPPMARG